MIVLCSGHTYAHVLFPNGDVKMVPIGQVAQLLWENDRNAL